MFEDESGSPPEYYVVIDDMVRSGNTLLECVAAVRKSAAHVSAAVVHADFVGDAVRRIRESGIERFFITDSSPIRAAEVTGVAPFEIVSIAPAIATVLCRSKNAAR